MYLNAALDVVLILIAAAYLLLRWRYVIDVSRIADNMAARLLRDFAPEELSERAVKDYTSGEYTDMALVWGMPRGAVDAVAAATWARVRRAKGPDPTTQRNVFYDSAD